MPTIDTPRDLFLHELGDLLYAENVLVKALPKMADEADDKKLREGFTAHLQETREHVDVLKQVFKALDETPKAEKCPAIEGIRKEHDDFVTEHDASPGMTDLFLTGSGARAEHYEIAAYCGLITMAKALGEDEAAKLLNKNLEQEQAALEELEKASRRLAKAAGNGATAA